MAPLMGPAVPEAAPTRALPGSSRLVVWMERVALPDWWWILVPAALLGAAFAHAKLLWHCRAPLSEACVWGTAFLRVESVLYGALAVALVGFAVAAWPRTTPPVSEPARRSLPR